MPNKGVKPNQYSPEFKRDAIALARSSDLSVRRVARDLGMSDKTLHNWLRQYKVDLGEAEGLTTNERKRLRELEQENRILREEREILKKAAAWFAKESDRR